MRQLASAPPAGALVSDLEELGDCVGVQVLERVGHRLKRRRVDTRAALGAVVEVIGAIGEYAGEVAVFVGADEEAHKVELPVLGLADLVGEVRVGLLGLQRDGGVASEDVLLGCLCVLKHCCLQELRS